MNPNDELRAEIELLRQENRRLKARIVALTSRLTPGSPSSSERIRRAVEHMRSMSREEKVALLAESRANSSIGFEEDDE